MVTRASHSKVAFAVASLGVVCASCTSIVDVSDFAFREGPPTMDTGTVRDAGLDAPIRQVLDLSAGEFRRPSRASYHISASEIRWAEPDERRFEDRGDGSGPQLLIEGGIVNYADPIDDLSAWFFDPDYEEDLSLDAVDAPDGTGTADRMANITGSGNRPVLSYGAEAFAGDLTASIYVRRDIGMEALVLAGQGNVAVRRFAPPVAWTRFHHSRTNATAEIPRIQVANHHDTSAVAGVAGEAHFWWGAQLELNGWPTSLAVGTRSPEELTYSAAPSWMLEEDWRVTVWPSFEGDESDGPHVIASFGSRDDVLQIERDAVQAVVGGAVVAEATGVSWVRHQPVEIRLRPHDGELSVATTETFSGTGTPWAWPAGPLQVGALYRGNGHFSGRIGAPEAL